MKTLATIATVLLCLLFNLATQPSAFDAKVAAPQTATKPGPANHMFYDVQRRQVVLLATNLARQEVLCGWEGKRWKLIPCSGPAARELGGAAYDTRRKRLV